MNKRSAVLILLILMLLPMTSHAQRWKLRRYEASLGIATTSFFGDIGGTADISNAAGFKDIQLQYTRPGFAFDIRYKLAGDMAVKFNSVFGFVAGNDVNSRNDGRNFAFRSTIFEPSLQFEYYILAEGRGFSSAAMFNRRGMVNNYTKVFIYLFGGVGGVLFNPVPLEDFEARFEDNFSKFAPVFPVGVGLKYTVDAKWSLGLELGRRFTTTDYIDGYSNPLYSKHNDTYYIGSFKVIYKVRTDRRGRPILFSPYRGRR